MKSRKTRATAPGSSWEKPKITGPLKTGVIHSHPVSANALFASVFFTTRKETSASIAAFRKLVICPTFNPRYSATPTDTAPLATAFTCSTTAFFASRLRAIISPEQLKNESYKIITFATRYFHTLYIGKLKDQFIKQQVIINLSHLWSLRQNKSPCRPKNFLADNYLINSFLNLLKYLHLHHQH